MTKNYNPPEFSKLIQLLLSLPLEYKGRKWTIDSWRVEKVKETEQNRRLQDKIAIFNIFTSALLSGYRTTGESNE